MFLLLRVFSVLYVYAVDFRNPPWNALLTCELVTSIILTADIMQLRINDALADTYDTLESAESAISDALVRSFSQCIALPDISVV